MKWPFNLTLCKEAANNKITIKKNAPIRFLIRQGWRVSKSLSNFKDFFRNSKFIPRRTILRLQTFFDAQKKMHRFAPTTIFVQTWQWPNLLVERQFGSTADVFEALNSRKLLLPHYTFTPEERQTSGFARPNGRRSIPNRNNIFIL